LSLNIIKNPTDNTVCTGLGRREIGVGRYGQRPRRDRCR